MKNLKSPTTLLTLLLIPAFTALRAAAEEPAAPGSIRTEASAKDNVYATVTLYQEGKMIGTMDYLVSNGGAGTFEKLPLGIYEVRFESPGYVTINRRTILRDGNEKAKVLVVMEKGQGAVTFGPGPSIQELEARLRKLEDACK